ncbi:MAG: collagen-like protein, partial [Fibrobacter sp.]|nr:collagen-like protein [Fibrobacter sp.]
MKKIKALTFVLSSTALAIYLSACGGDTTENITYTNENVGSVSSKDDLPECNEKIAGQTAFVKDDDAFYGCDGKKWRQLDGTTVSVGDNVCTSVALPDDEGFKIICNGDSIGVVRNGVDGTDGKDGADGQDGEKGEKGDTGATGATGAKGDKGATGATGAKGEKGDAGDNGTGCK